MSNHHIIKLNNEGQPEYWYQYTPETGHFYSESVSHWQDLPKQHDYIVLLPQLWVYQSQTSIPSKSIDVLRQSVAFAVEEELSNDLDQNHVAFKSVANNKQMVSVVSLKHLEALRDMISAHGLQVSGIHSYSDFCPKSEHQLTIMFEGDHVLVAMGYDDAMWVDQESLLEMLSLFGKDYDQVRSNRTDWVMSEKNMLPPFSEQDCAAALFSDFVVDIKPSSDWLKQYHASEQRQYKIIFVLFSMLLLSWVGIRLYQYILISSQAESIKTQQLDLLQQRYSDVGGSEFIDPFAAWQSRLKKLNQSGQSLVSPLTEATHGLGEVMQAMGGQIDLRAMRMIDDRLEISIVADSLTLINRFQQQLQSTAPLFKVLVGVNEQNEGRFNSVITMERL